MDTSSAMFSKGDKVRFKENLPRTPSKFKDMDLKVITSSKTGDRVKFHPLRKPSVIGTSSQDRMVFSPDHKMVVKADNSWAIEAMNRYGLKDTDVFITPDILKKFLSAVVGSDVSEWFDPAPARKVDWDGLQIDWKSPSYCNPPFSLTYQWIEKCVQQVLKGCDVILLISAVDYLVVAGVDRRKMWKDFRSRVHFQILACGQNISDVVQKWFAWGENVITQEKTGGPMFGVVLLRLSIGSGDSVLKANPAAEKVISDFRASKGRNKKTVIGKDISLVLSRMPSDGTVKLFELFCGTGSTGKIADTIENVRVISFDINEETMGYRPDIVADIMDIDFKSFPIIPDIIIAGPPCQTYSLMSHKHRTKDDMEPKTADAAKGKAILKKLIETIAYYHSINSELLFYIENPYGGRMKFETELFNMLPPYGQAVFSYYHYGFKYQKHTMIWSNDFNFLQSAKRCTKLTPCEYVASTGKHPEEIRPHSKDTTGPKTLAERYQYPPGLVKELLMSACTILDVNTAGSAIHELMSDKMIERQDKIAQLEAELKLRDEMISLHVNSSDTNVQLERMTSKVATLTILAAEETETGVNTPPAEVTVALSQTQSLKSDLSDDRQPYNILSGSDEELGEDDNDYSNDGNAVSHQFDDYSEYSD